MCSVVPVVPTSAASVPRKVAMRHRCTSQRAPGRARAGTLVLLQRRCQRSGLRHGYSIGRVEMPVGSLPANTQPTTKATTGMAITMRNRLLQGM